MNAGLCQLCEHHLSYYRAYETKDREATGC